jgi:hypothetical protein
MPTTAIYRLAGIHLATQDKWISQLQDCTPAMNHNYITEYASGAVVPSFQGAHNSMLDVRFTSPQLVTILDQTGFVGKDLSSENVDLYYQEHLPRVAPTAIGSLKHLRVRCLQSFLYWDRWTNRQGEISTLSCRIVPLFDGTNPPFTPLSDQVITETGLATEIFGLGPVDLNTTDQDGLQSWELDAGVEETADFASGEDFLSYFAIGRLNPIFTLTGRDVEAWETHGTDGTILTAIAAWSRKRKIRTTVAEANATEVHVKVSHNTNAGGLITVENSSGGVGAPADMNLRVAMDQGSDATLAHPLQLDTTAAIT